jgi:hypothetical protein
LYNDLSCSVNAPVPSGESSSLPLYEILNSRCC